ncbi:MAG: hypothetical protein R2932_02970 [Caldilineaceae bacterium]
MRSDQFYQTLIACFALPPTQRHAALVHLHEQIVNDYVAALNRISAEQAAQALTTTGDCRTLADVVGHIAAWERFGILAASDILIGCDHPRSVTDVHGYVDADGSVHNFADVHAFNAYHSQKNARRPWPDIQQEARATAEGLYALFSHPHLLTAEKLEQTKPHRKRLRSGPMLEHTTMGWCLWVIYLDHEAVEHAVELRLPGQ